MISIIITSFKEPKTIGKAIESFINQDMQEDYELYVIAPDDETLNVAKTFQKKNKRVKLLRDPGKGKTFALNKFLPKMKGRVLILSDGDVYVSKNSVKSIIKPFEDPKVGCVTGYPVSSDKKDNIFGYWSHLLCDSAHYLRKKRAEKKQFLECSGYLWTFRSKVIERFPSDVAEDSIVPYLFAQKGYKIAYASQAQVFVKFPNNLHDFIEQKKRTTKAHENLDKYIDVKKIPKMKTFKNEAKGSLFVLSYPQNIREVFYTLLLFPIRLYIWGLVFYHTHAKKDLYQDAWKRVESTK